MIDSMGISGDSKEALLSLSNINRNILVSIVALSFAIPMPAIALQSGTHDGATVNGVDQTLEIDCKGRPAMVSGSDNQINFIGDCPSLTLNGVDNRVTISLRPGAPVRVSGVDNVVTWRINGKGRPSVSVKGVDNQVRAAN